MNLFQKMSAITKEIATVGKNLEVELPNNKGYKAVSEVDVLKAVKPAEEKYGVYSYPAKREIVESGEIVNQTKYGERKSLFVRVETVYRFVNVDEPSEYIEVTTYGDGVDSQDKAPGKAMTYADKYALLKAYKIQTGDDPDAEGSGDLVSRDKAVTPAQRKTLLDLCAKHKIDATELAKRNGYTSGAMTEKVWAKCMMELKNVEDL